MNTVAVHVVLAAIHGVLDPLESDELAASFFRYWPVESISQAYWKIFRTWTDATDPIPMEFRQGLLRLWEWRLDEIEPRASEDRAVAEAAAMDWLVRTPHLSVDIVIPLARRTIAFSVRRGRAGPLWDRVTTFAITDVSAALGMATDLIEARLRGAFPSFPLDDVAPVLRRAVTSEDPATREHAIRLIHRLGERGFLEFGALLPRPVEETGGAEDKHAR